MLLRAALIRSRFFGRHSERAVFSIEALELHKSGSKVLIEHVSPLRHLTQKAIEQIDLHVSDAQFAAFVQEHHKLVLLSPAETQRLNKQNRTKMHPDRLTQADIQLVVMEIGSLGLPDSNYAAKITASFRRRSKSID
jgi:hypothetical protein